MTVPRMSDVLVPGTYPGRVVVLARTPVGELLGGVALTGRSRRSRERVLVPDDGALVVAPAFPGPGSGRAAGSSLTARDPLRHYTAAVSDDTWTVFGNGDHVETVAKRLATGTDPRLALDGLEYEPDPPIFTPRITAVVERATGHAWLGAARHAEGLRSGTDVTVTTLGDLGPCEGVVLTTYEPDVSDAEPFPVASRRHRDVVTRAGGAITLLDELWSALRGPHRVAASTFVPRDGVLGPVRLGDAD
ncbi:IMP cyclohydrolase [Luteimicrobium album]|uniref:IMP cyclohydrolase n=1 Tax=Luteimicrobium album TaxID=1054550 RepID=UPI0024E0BB93|nr:IMP cyclohydrolase [Luteimicrobium album]